MVLVTTASRGRSGGVPVNIMMRIVHRGGAAAADSDDEGESSEREPTCYICANAFCCEDECSRAMTHMGCCTQAICCGCLLKSSKRCGCKEDCDAVISLCPFCREVSPVDALDLFLATKAACKACRKHDEDTAVRPPTAVHPEVIDLAGDSSDSETEERPMEEGRESSG